MIDNLYHAFLINNDVMPMMPYFSALNLSCALAGIYVFLRKTQIVLWGLVFFGTLWTTSELPYSMQATLIASLGFRGLYLIFIYLVVIKLMNKPMPTIIHPDW